MEPPQTLGDAVAPDPPSGDGRAPIAAATADGKTTPSRRVRQLLIIGVSTVALLCLGGGTAAFLFYDKVTKPDLSTPPLVTRKYLAAYLVDRDDVKAGQFQCANSSGLADVGAFRSDIDAREKKFGVTIAVSVDSVSETARSGSTANVDADLVLNTVIQGQSQHAVEHWTFVVRNDGGWRVCSGHEVT